MLYYGSSTQPTGPNEEEEELDPLSNPAPLNGIHESGYPEFDAKRVLTLADDTQSHFQRIGTAELCYVEGTDVDKTLELKDGQCKCRPDYFGRECGIPASVWYRTVEQKYDKWKLIPRKVPRRIIHGLNINHEINFFQVRLEELQVRMKNVGPRQN